MQAMRDRGFDMVGLVLENASPAETSLDPVISHESFGEVHTYRLFSASQQAVYDPTPGIPEDVEVAADRVLEVVKLEAPDLIVISGFSLKMWYLARAAMRLKIPYLMSHHGMWFAEIAPTLPQAAQDRMRRMEFEATMGAVQNVYLNHWSITQLRQEYPQSDRDNDVVIPLPFNPIFLEPTPPMDLSVEEGSLPIVGFVGRWDPIKNPALIREVAERSSTWRIVAPLIVGQRASLQDEEEKFLRAVRVIPPLAPESLAKFYRACDLLILPSRFDVNPTVVMEAALQGKGTIITNTVGWYDAYVRHDMTDWIAQPTVESLYQAIEHNLGTPCPSSFIDEIREHHHPDRVFDAWAELLEVYT